MTDLGMPGLPRPSSPPWKHAWDQALFGAQGYLRRHATPPQFDADLVVGLVRDQIRGGGDEVALLGSAGVLAPRLAEIAPVRFDVPPGFAGLVLACDWLSHVPAHVVEVAATGYPTLVHVDPATGRENLGSRLNETSVPQSIGLWLERWWPLVDDGIGARAEVGTGRDAAWAGVVARLGPGGRAIAVEPAHLAGGRPREGALACEGLPDGSGDITAAVALDSVAEAAGCEVRSEGATSWVVRSG